MMKTKTFDCVEMKHQAAEQVQAQMAGMSDEEKIAFLNRVAEDFRAQQANARRTHPASDIIAAGTD